MNIKKRLAAIVIAGSAAAAMSVTLSAAPASATNETTCGSRTDLVKIRYKSGPGNSEYVACYANRGSQPLREWVVELSTGNNRVRVYDMDGDKFTLPKWEVYKPSKPFQMIAFKILPPHPHHRR